MAIFNPTGRSRAKGWQAPAAAFSLVEVTLALGIFAFGLTAVFGLVPLGLSNFRRAMDTSIGSQIGQQVANDVQQTDFNVLTGETTPAPSATPGATPSPTPMAQPVRYFDDQGDEVAATSTGSPSGPYLYEVNTVVTPATVLPTSAADANLATVLIQIIKNPNNKTNIVTNSTTKAWNDPSFSILSYTDFVSRNQGLATPSP